jgi:hypothetical protein
MRRATREKPAFKEKVEALIRERSNFGFPLGVIWRDDHLSTLQETYDYLMSHPEFKFDKESWA